MIRLSDNRPWPAKAVVTAGMPYGNKDLHFGHIGGVFIPADCFARFLRDRIGADNVRFVSGTDCYGSPIDEGYRKYVESEGFTGSITEYVQTNHEAQKRTLAAFDIDLSLYEGSGLGRSGDVHQALSDAFVTALHENGFLSKRSTLQFYDAEADMFLNGRQVVGHCPVQGCKSIRGYADECDLGHQYSPEDLIAPVSTVTGTVPEMHPVTNWYFDLPAFAGFLRDHVRCLEEDDDVRALVSTTIKEFLLPPIIYIKSELYDAYHALAHDMPEHIYRDAEKGKQSFEIEFSDIEERDQARAVLVRAGIRFRTGKTLVPFRITGNIEWGVKAPELEGVTGLTIWCWPESLWAPLSFTMAYHEKIGLPADAWRDFWCAEDSCVYQFIGQDNLYFYGVAQPALFKAVGDYLGLEPPINPYPLKQTMLVANHHVLFGDKKASSSSAIKPPGGEELLEHYTAEQLRAHFLALGLDQKSVGFKPKAFEGDEEKRDDPRVADPVLKESALLTNVFNRLARSCFYEAQNNFDGRMPLGAVSAEVREQAHTVMAAYDDAMHRVALHTVMSLMDDFIRWANKYWTERIRIAEETSDETLRRRVLVDCFYLLRVCTVLMHPVVPRGTEKICEYLCFERDSFFKWEHDFTGMEELCAAEEVVAGSHALLTLPPRTDFFEKHPSQYKK